MTAAHNNNPQARPRRPSGGVALRRATDMVPQWFRLTPTPLCHEERRALGRRGTIEGPRQLARLLRSRVRAEPVEVLWVVLLSARRHLIGLCEAGRGDVDLFPFRPAQVYRPALLAGASAIYLAHNHPSGSLRPSDADLLTTVLMMQAGRVMGVECGDHVILSPSGGVRSLVRYLLVGRGVRTPLRRAAREALAAPRFYP